METLEAGHESGVAERKENKSSTILLTTGNASYTSYTIERLIYNLTSAEQEPSLDLCFKSDNGSEGGPPFLLFFR